MDDKVGWVLSVGLSTQLIYGKFEYLLNSSAHKILAR